MVYGYTESDVIAELRGWNEMSGDNDVVCVGPCRSCKFTSRVVTFCVTLSIVS